jgi:hypothetical protein
MNLHRRALLKAGGALGLTAVVPLIPGCGDSSPLGGVGPGTGSDGPTVPARFLDQTQLETLKAFVDRMIPADLDPGAVAAGAADAIDYLLAAFKTDPPFIWAGAPFSDRAGHPVNEFEKFIALDEYEAFAWRLAIEGSQGIAAREFNGPVKGMQQIYVEGLAALDAAAQSRGYADFAAAPEPIRDLIVHNPPDDAVADLVDIGYIDTLDAMYGAPEYGGNKNLVGWTFAVFDGDVHPRGYTRDQVINADNPGLFDPLLPPSFDEDPANGKRLRLPGAKAVRKAMPIVAHEEMLALVHDAQGSLRKLRARMRPIVQYTGGLADG